MASSGHDSSTPPPGGRPPRKPRSFTPLAAMRAQVHEGAKELVVDDFVDTYFQERPKTLPPISPKGVVAPPPPAEPSIPSRSSAEAAEESGIRKAVALGGQAAAIEVSIPEDEDLVVMEAELADRDDKITSLEDELQRLRGEIGELRSTRGADLAAPPQEPEAPPPLPDVAPTAAAPTPGPTPDASVVRPAGPSRQGRSGLQLALGSALAIAAIAALSIGLTRRSPDERPQPAIDPRSSTTGVAAAPEEPRAEPVKPPEDTPREAASTPQVPSAPATVPAAQPSAEPSASPAEPLPALLSFQAFLTVRSAVDAEVVVQGQSVGRTNERLLTRCGPRNVRLRQGAEWISPGEHVRIVCMEHTDIRVDPAVADPAAGAHK